MKERLWLTELDRIKLKQIRNPGADQSRESAERERAFAQRAAAIEKLKHLRMKTP